MGILKLKRENSPIAITSFIDDTLYIGMVMQDKKQNQKRQVILTIEKGTKKEASFGLGIYLILIWILVISLSCYWNYIQNSRYENEIIKTQASAIFDLLVVTRSWGSAHESLYVPITEDSPANPWLKTKNRDIVINGKEFTKINPSYMTRQISEITAQNKGMHFKMTSLTPIRPDNNPSDWEKEALLQFEKGCRYKGEIIKEFNNTEYRYMKPLFTEKDCLQCHRAQGYKKGQIRGGIRISIPYDKPQTGLNILISHAGIGLAGLLLILLLTRLLHQSYRRIEEMAYIDSLTALPNRRAFNFQYSAEYQRSHREQSSLSMLICDVDFFKQYNDTYGHKEGDIALEQVASAIENNLNRGGDFAARFGGEEFTVILPNTDMKGAQGVAEKVRQAVADLKIEHTGNKPHNIITISIGIASSRSGNVDEEQLIRKADEKLYIAKSSGRNTVCF